jgi:acetolactate decarboxylase
VFDEVLRRLRATQLGKIGHGHVNQARAASALFAGNFSGTTTVGHEFGQSILGLGVMDNLEGEIVSLDGETWRIPTDGTPLLVGSTETIAFGIAASGGLAHYLPLTPGLDMAGILAALDSYLQTTHVDHEDVVCAIKIEATFTDVVLRTVGHPTYEGETLGDIIDEEIRFSFDSWGGTLVGFRYPDATTGETIPGLHLHAISHNRTSGGHVRNATLSAPVVAALWIDELHLSHDTSDSTGTSTPVDFDALEGPLAAP